MRCTVEQEDGSFAVADCKPSCGVDFCDACGDCLACYGEDKCSMSGDGCHIWVKYKD